MAQKAIKARRGAKGMKWLLKTWADRKRCGKVVNGTGWAVNRRGWVVNRRGWVVNKRG